MIVVQPHFDDAVIGLGARMMYETATARARRGLTGPLPVVRIPECHVITVCAGTPHPYPDLAHRPHDDTCGFVEGDDVVAQRTIEDDVAIIGTFGWSVTRMPFLDAQYRQPPYDRLGPDQIDAIIDAVETAVADRSQVVPEKCGIWLPAGIAHPDHRAVAEAGRVLEARGHDVWYWLEPGYRSRFGWQSTGEVLNIPLGDPRAKLALIRLYVSQLHGLSAACLYDAIAAECYTRCPVEIS